MNMINSYSSIYTLGHNALRDLYNGEVIIEEKIDGSQFSMMRKDGKYYCRSKGKEIYLDNPEKMFSKAIETMTGLDLTDGWIYRCEYLQKPKHNSLAYDRIPDKHLIIFDIDIMNQTYMPYKDKKKEAKRLGLEIVPIMYKGNITDSKFILDLLDNVSILGGQDIEGIVIKNYSQYGKDKKVLMGKYVSERFKEVHRKEWKKENPTNNDLIQNLILQYKTEARWDKAIIHLKEQGLLENSPKDIGILLKEIQEDIKKECEEEIKQMIFNKIIPKIMRGCTGGFPEYYKKKLLKESFND